MGFVGLLLRAWVLLTPSGVLNSDEAVTGLSSMDVARGRFHLMIPESYYTVLVESYLFSPVVKVFGGRIVLLKLMPWVLWLIASVLGAGIVRRLAGERGAIAAFAGLWLIPGAMLIVTTQAYLAYAGGVIIVFGAIWSMVVTVDDGPTVRRSLLTGVLVGVAFMQHPIYVSVLAPAAIVVTVAHLRAWRVWHVPGAIGVIVGCSPWLIWNATNGFASLEERDAEPATYTERVGGFFRELIPRDFGLMDPSGEWLNGRAVGTFLYLLLIAATVYAVVRLCQAGPSGWVIAVPAVVGWLILGVFQHTSFVADGRYGIAGFPIVVLCLATLLGGEEVQPLGQLWRGAVVVGWVLVLVLPYQLEVVGTKLGDPNAVNASLIGELDRRGIELLEGPYFLVLPVSYATDERIATAVFAPLPVRYPHLQQRVREAPPESVAVAFRPGEFNKDLLRMPQARYLLVDLPGVELYVPIGAS